MTHGGDIPVRAFGSAPAGGIEVEPVEDGERIAIEGVALRALHTPGHARDHLCFFLEEEEALFAGDNVLGEGTSVIAPPEGRMLDYLASLRRLQELPVKRIYPGHFRALHDGREVLARYLEHRRVREGQVVEAMRSGAATVDEIVERAYADTATDLHPVARYSVLAHLEMLEEQGKVVRDGERWSARQR